MRSKILIILVTLIVIVFQGYSQRYGESDDFSYALKLYNEGFYDIAAQQFNIFVTRYPNSERVPEAKYYLGLSLYNAKDFENARIEFQSMAVSFPEHSRAPEAWQKVGESYQEQDKLEEAARAFETVKILYPKDPNAPFSLFQAAQIYFNINKYEKAELTLKDFLDRYPDSDNYPNGRLLYANLLLKKQDFDQAYNEYEKVLKSGADNEVLAATHMGLGELYAGLGQFERAKQQYQTILNQYATSSSSFNAIQHYSEILAITEDYQTAVRVINENVSRYRNQLQKTSLNLILTGIYLLQEDYYSGRKTLETISTTGLPDSLQLMVHFYLGHCHFGEKNFQKSINQFENVLEYKGKNTSYGDYRASAMKYVGLAYLNLNHFDQGISYLMDYINNYPEKAANENIYSIIFYSNLRENKFTDAERTYQEILIKQPDYPFRDELLYSKSKKYFHHKKYQLAYQGFHDFIRDYSCSTKYDSASMYYSIIQENFLVDQEVGVHKLTSLIYELLADYPKQKLILELAKIYLFQLKDLDAAIQVAESIIQSSKDSTALGEAYHILAESYRRKGQIKKFNRMGNDNEKLRLQQAFKNAMAFVKSVEFPDSLAFTFLSETAGIASEGIPIDKKIQFWVLFKSNYPESKFIENAGILLAELYRNAGQTERALQEFAELRSAKSINIAGNAYYQMGKIYYEQNDMKQTANVLKEFLLNIKEHPMRANAFGLLAKNSEKQGNYEEAAQFWARLRREYNYSPAAIAAKNQIPEVFLIAREYQAVIDYTEEYTKYNICRDLVLRKVSEIPELDFFFYNGKAHYHLKDFVSARRTLLNYLYNERNGKYHDEALFLLAEIALEEDDPEGALLHLQVITRNESSSFYLQATAQIADIYFDQKKYAEAQPLYNILITRISSEQTVQFKVSEMICLINQGALKQYSSKLSDFKNQHRKDANFNNHLAHLDFELGKYYFQNKNYDAGIKKFENVIKNYPKSDYADDAEYYLGLTYATLNKVDKAMDILSRFAEKYPNSILKSNIYVTLGGLYYRAEKRELAVGAFQKAVETAKEPEARKVALSNIISLYRDLGLWDGVLTQARMYVEEFSNAEDVVDKKIIMGNAMINLNRYSEAIDHLTNLKFEANSEQEPEIQFYIGEAYFNAGQYESAIREFVKIPLLSKQTKLQWEASALYYSGQAYEKMGKKEDAIRMYQEIVERPGILAELKREAQKRIEQLRRSD
jgi:tol-pal system protein YbgF